MTTTTSNHWRRIRTTGCALLFLLAGFSHISSAQSLGDLARDAERRTHVAQALTSRVYTNADLVPLGAPSPAPLPTEVPEEPDAEVPDTAISGDAAEPEDGLQADAIHVEAPDRYAEQRRTRVQDFQGRLTKTEAGITAAQARLDRLDTTPDTPTTLREREVITETLRRLERDADALRRSLAPLMAQAGGESGAGE